MYKKKNREIIIGSNNTGKIKEIRDLLPKTYKIFTPNDFSLTRSPKENGKSFTENSLIKAEYYSKKTRKICIADDSGLEVNYLYKSSQTLRILFHTLENVKFKHHDSINNNINSNNINSFGIGLRVKSILGPINFLWTKGEKKLFNNNNNENYYFSIGIDY